MGSRETESLRQFLEAVSRGSFLAPFSGTDTMACDILFALAGFTAIRACIAHMRAFAQVVCMRKCAHVRTPSDQQVHVIRMHA